MGVQVLLVFFGGIGAGEPQHGSVGTIDSAYVGCGKKRTASSIKLNHRKQQSRAPFPYKTLYQELLFCDPVFGLV